MTPLRLALSELAAASAPGSVRPPFAIRSPKYLLESATVFGAYFLCGKIGLAVPFTSGNVSPVWPPAGIALAALLLVGYRVWPAITAAAFLVNLLSPMPAGIAMALAAGNTAGPVLGAWLVQRFLGFRASLRRLDDVLGLVALAAPASAALSATVGVTVLFLSHVNPWVRFWPAWIVWWFGDATGVLVVAPLVLTVLTQKRIIQRRQVPEVVALLAAAVVTSLVIFDARVAFFVEKDVLAFAVLPVVLWGATRFEVPGATGVTLVIASVAVWETGSGYGPFVRNSTLENATMLQAFIIVIAVSGLTLAAMIVERAQWARQQAQHEGERRYHEIVATANDGIWMLDAALVTVFVNPRMAEILGYTVEEMMTKPLSHFVDEAVWSQKRAALQSPGPVGREHAQARYRKKDGSELWATVSRTRAFAEDGTFTGVLKMVSDISDQRRAEAEREKALDRVALLSEAVEQTADSVLISDSRGRIQYVNSAFEVTTGFPRAEALGNTPRILKSGQHGAGFYREMWARLLAGQSYRGTLINRKKTGELYWANQTITPIKGPKGDITHFVSVLQDVTDARKYDEREVQFRLARGVQQRFYRTPPCLPGFDIGADCHPAHETGGDYFDFIEAPEGVLYVAIGDVSGHGFDAALIMALTRAYMRSFAALGLDVEKILELANRAIAGDLEENRYVTLLLVRLDPQARTMTYASAGHIPGVLLSASGGTDVLMESTGIPLGLFAGSTYAARRIPFRAQHILVLGTDGATETCAPDGVEFGCRGVTEYVRAHANATASEMAAGIYGAARSFGGAQPQHDDITSVVIKIAGDALFPELTPLTARTPAQNFRAHAPS